MICKVCFFRTEKNAFYGNWIGFTNYKSVWTGKKSVFCSPGSRSPKSNHFFPMSQWCFYASLVKIHQLVQKISVQSRLIFSLYSVVNSKIRSRSPKSDNIFKPSQRYKTWSLARICHLVQEIGCRQALFLVKIWKFYSFYNVVTLKIRSWSPKSYQIFKPSKCYNIWSLTWIHQEIGCNWSAWWTMVKKRKLRWYGHISRSSGMAKTILQGTVKGTRRRGRQKKW